MRTTPFASLTKTFSLKTERKDGLPRQCCHLVRHDVPEKKSLLNYVADTKVT